MRKYLITSSLCGLLGLFALNAAAASPVPESCEQIRSRIRAHAGLSDRPNTALLAKVGENRKCRFTSAEAYRAAWGDKPMPKDERPSRRAGQREHDDD